MKINFVISFTKDNKHFAYVEQVDSCTNLYGRFDKFYAINGGTTEIVMFAPSMKKAQEIANAWNENYKKNGTLFIQW